MVRSSVLFRCTQAPNSQTKVIMGAHNSCLLLCFASCVVLKAVLVCAHNAARGARCMIQCLDNMETAVPWDYIVFKDIIRGKVSYTVAKFLYVDLVDCHRTFGSVNIEKQALNKQGWTEHLPALRCHKILM